MRPKILFVVNVDWFFVSHRLPIAVAAQNFGYDVHIACQVTDKKQELEGYGFTVHSISLERSGTSVLKEFQTMLSIYRLIKKISPSLMHMITVKPVIYAGIAARILGVSKVASISGLGFVFIAEGFKSKLLRSLITILYKLALNDGKSRVIFQNDSDKGLFIRRGIISDSNTLIVRGSGVDLDKYQVKPEPESYPVIVLLARLLIDKGVLEFVQAAEILKSKGVPCKMVLAGDTDENPKSVNKNQIADWVNKGIVEYWGYSKDVNSTYANCHIAVLPSYREGLPKSLIEAAACGRAVITTDVPGCRDAITPNKTGLLVPVKSSLELALAIETLCNDSKLRQSLGQEGRQLAEQAFDIKSVIQIHLNLYADLLKGKPSV
ncbi:glycosyltransferase family 4 protein [Shewanella bicestrii]